MGHAQRVTRSDHRQLRLPDGRIMGYALYGDPTGVPVLAIHGSPGSRIMMQPADPFASQHAIFLIAPDRPGYGLSTNCPNYSFKQWVADIEALLASLQIDHFRLFGVSGGGPFATALAALMPQRVIAMALVSPVGIFDQGVRESWSWRHQLFFGVLPRYRVIMTPLLSIARLLLLAGARIFMKLFIFGLSRPDRLILRMPHNQSRLLAAFREGLRSGISGVREDLSLFASLSELPLQNVDMPVIVWQGTRDLMVPEKAALKLAHRFADVEIITLTGQGHFWIFDHFQEVLERLMALPETQSAR